MKTAAPLFGLEASRDWILLAQHRDETLLYNATAFELGDRLGMRFNHSFNFAEVYLNGAYRGLYLVTESNQAAKGRVDIDKDGGWFVEIDEYYDNRPRFRTVDYKLPVMIRFPRVKGAGRGADPAYNFIRSDINALAAALASTDFPNSGYREMIDMDSFIAYLMINEITANTDLSHPRSLFMYKDKNGKIALGPLWDFDSGYGWHYNNWLTSGFNDHFNYPDRRPPVHPFIKKFYEDPVFCARFREVWNKNYDTIASMPIFFDEMAEKLKVSADRNFEAWWYKTLPPFTDTAYPVPNDFRTSIQKLKTWYAARIFYLNRIFNGADTFPPAAVKER